VKRFKNILLFVDQKTGGKAILRRAAALAQNNRAQLTVVDVIDLAAEHGIDLIVMGTVCRTGVAGFFIGNTAENVLQQVDCSVLTVKPEGFVSPVNLAAA